MGILGKLFGEKAPEWAQPISPQLYKEFQRDAIKAIQEVEPNPSFDWEDGTVGVRGDSLRLGFHNLIRMWMDSQPSERINEILNFISVLLTQFDCGPMTIGDKLHLLKPRVMDPQQKRGYFHAATRPFGRNLYSSLVVDEERVMRFVNESDLESEGLDYDSLFRTAIENLRRESQPDVSRKVSSSGQLTIIGLEYLGAAQIFILDKYTEAGETYLVTAPSRDTLILFKPTELSNKSLDWLLLFAQRTYDTISIYRSMPFVLKYKDGVFEDLTEEKDDRVVVCVD